jgi:hypothetical protein
MNYTTDMSFLNSSNALLDIVSGVNTASGNLVGAALMILLFIGLLAGFLSKNYDFGQSLIISSFFCVIVSALLFFMDLLAWWIAVIFIVSLIIGIMVEAFGK